MHRKLASLFAILGGMAYANTCTPITVAAVPSIYPAITNGVAQGTPLQGGVSFDSAWLLWNIDGTANQHRVRWGTTSGSYNHTYMLPPVTIATTAYVSAALTNLPESTTIYAVGESFETGPNGWCTASAEMSFTTLAYSQVQHTPTLPIREFFLTAPTVTGTDYVLGSTCGSGTTSADFQTCLNGLHPGDGLGIPSGVTISTGATFTLPLNPNNISVTVSGSTLTYSATTAGGGSTPTISNGQQIRMSATYYLPAPLQIGFTYYITNLNTGSRTFQVATSNGGTAVVFTNNGLGTIYFQPWPISQPWIVLHSTASTNGLPPYGTSLNPTNVGTYSSAMPVIQKTTPLGSSSQQPIFTFQPLTAYLWIENLQIGTAATGTSETDPPWYDELFTINQGNDHIVLDRDWIRFAPAPDRIRIAGDFLASSTYFLGTYISDLNFWKPFRTIPNATVSTNTVAYAPGFFSWVKSNGTKGVCTISSTITITFTGTGSFVSYYDQSCTLHVDVTSGATASGTGVTATTVSSPAFPVSGASHYTGLNLGSGSVSSGTVSYSDQVLLNYDASNTTNNTEGSLGVHVIQNPGPFVWDGVTCIGSGVTCLYFPDDLASNGCATVGSGNCLALYHTSNVTVRRSTINYDPKMFPTGPQWDGGEGTARNGIEFKDAHIYQVDGNQFSGYIPYVGQGECIGSEEFASNTYAGYVSWNDGGDVTITNNTCANSSEGIQMGRFDGNNAPRPMRRINISNNLFKNVQGYLNPPIGIYAASGPYFTGSILHLPAGMSDIAITHNTIMNNGGTQPILVFFVNGLPGGFLFKDNVVSYPNDGNTGGLFFSGVCSQFGGTCESPNYTGYQNNQIISVLTRSQLLNNIILPTWQTSNPTGYVEFTGAQITSLQSALNGIYPGGNVTPLSSRIAAMKFFNSGTGDYRLKPNSSYQSGGALPASDQTAIGVDYEQLCIAQGCTQNAHVFGIGTTTATVGVVAPDSFACPVDISTNNFSTWTRFAGVAGRVENVAITGLTSGTTYQARINCAVSQPIVSFTTK